MPRELLIYQLVLAVASAVCLAVALQAWRRRNSLGAPKLALLNVGTFIWTFVTLVSTFFRGDPLIWIPLRLTILGASITIFAMFVFTLEYTGRTEYLTRRTYALLAIEPVLATTLSLTNGAHSLFWTEGPRNPSTVFGFEQTLQLGFFVHGGYSYLLVLAVVIMLGQFAVRSDFLFQRQVFAIFVGIMCPWLGNIAFLLFEGQYDFTMVGFVVTGVALYWATTAVGLLDITPVARDRIVDTLDAGVFVIDRKERVIDINDKGRKLLAVQDQQVTGKHVSSILDQFPSVEDVYHGINNITETASIETMIGERSFSVRVSPLYDERDMLAGRVILVHEITEQVNRRETLRHRNEQLDRFASVVSHDLRNPLHVASGNLELFRQTRDDDQLDNIEDALGRMETIITDVLTLARTDGEEMATQTVSVASVARAAWKNVATEDGTLDIAGDMDVVANRTLLMQLFENLFRNSLEHGRAPPDSASSGLTVSVGELENGFYVEDDGLGIPEHKRDGLFEPGVSNKADGTGLGLMIVNQVATVHDWTVTVTEGETGGARFEISTLSGRQTRLEPTP